MKYWRTSLFLVILLFSTLGIFLAAGEDWPMFSHDADLTGYTTASAPGTNATLWKFRTAGDVWSPVVKGGKLFILSDDGFFYCLNASTGAVIWKNNLTDDLVGAKGPAKTRTAATVVGGKIYGATGGSGAWGTSPYHLFCLDESTGNLIWQNSSTTRQYGMNVLMVNETSGYLYTGAYDGCVSCYDAATGATIWSKTATAGGWGNIYHGPALANGRLYFACYTGTPRRIFCLDANTGDKIWNYSSNFIGGVASGPLWAVLVSDNKVYVDQENVTRADGKPYFGKVYCLDANTGDVATPPTSLWNFTVNATISSPFAVHGDRLFFGTRRTAYSGIVVPTVYCLNKTDGTLFWSYTTEGSITYSGPAISGDGKVLIGDINNILYCLNEVTGALIWKYRTGASIYGSPAIASASDGIVFLGSWDDTIYAIGPPPPKPPVELNEFLVNVTGLPGDQTGQWVEIINTGASDVNVTNWEIRNSSGTIGRITTPTTLSSGAVYVFDNLPANSLSNVAGLRWIGLYDADSIYIDDVAYSFQYAYESQMQLYDGANWAGDLWDRDNIFPSKGYKNYASPAVKVNEVLYDNATMDPVEFIEIYNMEASPVNIDNWNIRYKYFKLVDLMGSLGAGEHTVLYWGINFTDYLHDNYGNVFLLNENNQTVDMMTWGTQFYYDELGATATFPYACPDVATGKSLQRIPAGTDTDKDKNDFTAADPSPCTLLQTLPGVGGTVTPIDKLLMLMPWIGIISAIVIATAATAINFKKRRL